MSFEDKIRWISASMKPVQLTELKSRYKYVIDSKRKYSQIDDFWDLVGILITRGVVSPNDVTVINEVCLEYFGINFNDIPDPLHIVKNPQSYLQGNRNPQSVANSTAQPVFPSDSLNGNISGRNDGNNNLNVLLGKAFDIIVAGSISEKQWRPFARALKVDTDCIANETSTANKIDKALAKFSQSTDQLRQWPLLEVALEKIRRMDLRDQCRDLFDSQL